MKKIFIKTYSFLSVLIITAAFLGCNFKFGDTSLLTEPTVDYSSSILTISIPRVSKSTKYINIYRQDLTDLKESAYDDAAIVNIGLIFPENLTSGGSNYQFQDTLVNKSHAYRYKVRYCETSGYYYSDWSTVITASGSAYDSDAVLTYSAENVTFTFDDSDYSLTINGNITAPSAITNFTTYFKPSLVIESGSAVKVFQLSNNIIEAIENGATDEETISLKGILASDFFDADLKIVGIVGQQKQYADDDEEAADESEDSDDSDEEKAIIRVIWTEPVVIDVTDYTDNIISVSSSAATDAFDFSGIENN